MTFDEEEVEDERRKAIEYAMKNPKNYDTKKYEQPKKVVRVAVKDDPESTNALKCLSSSTVSNQEIQRFYLDGE